MEITAAIGVAAAVFQFCLFSNNVFTLVKELYDRKSPIKTQEQIKMITDLRTATSDLANSKFDQQNPVHEDDRKLIRIASHVNEMALELLQELERLDPSNVNSRMAALSLYLDANKRRQKLRDMQNQMESYQEVLKTQFLMSLNRQSKEHTVNIGNLQDNVKDIARLLLENKETCGVGLSRLENLVDRGVDQIIKEMRMYRAEYQSKSQLAELRKSLFFERIWEREDNIKNATTGTYQWIFRTSDDALKQRMTTPDNATFVEGEIKWDDFPHWLGREDKDDIAYWIYSKAGAGKSVLMDTIVQDDKTREILKFRLSGSKVFIFKHFFWNYGGDPLQKNFNGLIRSLLFQILNSMPSISSDLVDSLATAGKITRESSGDLLVPTWTKKRLLAAFDIFLSSIQDDWSILICVDGLDESTDDKDELFAFLHRLTIAPQIKLCVSSRPEGAFNDEFNACPQLRLQDLNFSDIKTTVDLDFLSFLDKRYPDQDVKTRTLSKNLARGADGVYLWAYVVIQDLKERARNRASLRELEDRLSDLPEAMEDLFDRMLEKLDKHYRKAAALFFGILMNAPIMDWTITLFAMADEESWEKTKQRDFAYFASNEFDKKCSHTKDLINSRCVGLAEISKEPKGSANDDYGMSQMLIEDIIRQNGCRSQECLSPSAGGTMLIPESGSRAVKLIHRTVFDFFCARFETYFGQPLSSVGHLQMFYANANFLAILSETDLLSAKARSNATVEYGQVSRLLLYFVNSATRALESAQSQDSGQNSSSETIYGQLTTKLFSICSQTERCLDLASPRVWYHWRMSGHEKILSKNCFLEDADSLAAYFGLYPKAFPSSSLQNCSQEKLNKLLICAVLCTLTIGGTPMGKFDLIEYLLTLNANVNSMVIVLSYTRGRAILREASAWSSFFGQLFWRYLGYNSPSASKVSESDIRLVRLFISHDADVNTSFFSDYCLQDDERTYTVTLEETPLSLIERMPAKTQGNTIYSQELLHLLLTNGAYKYRRCRELRYHENKEICQVQYRSLNLQESKQLLETYPSVTKIREFVENGDFKFTCTVFEEHSRLQFEKPRILYRSSLKSSDELQLAVFEWLWEHSELLFATRRSLQWRIVRRET